MTHIVIWHPKEAWYCTDGYGNFFFSGSHPDTVHGFKSLDEARERFADYPQKDLLEIWSYPKPANGRKKLFSSWAQVVHPTPAPFLFIVDLS